MCSIMGYFDKTGSTAAPVGRILLDMLTALGCRGPDSTGIAVYGGDRTGLKLQIKLGEGADFRARADAIVLRVEAATRVRSRAETGAYLRLVVDADADPGRMIEAVEGGPWDDAEVVSTGRSLEIVKQVGAPEGLERDFAVSRLTGTHGIGHTRLSTESRVDLSHSQPFWAHGLPDVAAAHNGHITNYHRLRRIYEQRGVRFHTENDSEIVGIYLRDRMARGDSFEQALQASMNDFDGSFCYVAATADALAVVKDRLSLKPLVVAETDAWAAVATEEIGLRRALGDAFMAREPQAGSIYVWRRPASLRAAA